MEDEEGFDVLVFTASAVGLYRTVVMVVKLFPVFAQLPTALTATVS